LKYFLEFYSFFVKKSKRNKSKYSKNGNTISKRRRAEIIIIERYSLKYFLEFYSFFVKKSKRNKTSKYSKNCNK